MGDNVAAGSCNDGFGWYKGLDLLDNNVKEIAAGGIGIDMILIVVNIIV